MFSRILVAPAFMYSRGSRIVLFLFAFSISFLVVWSIWWIVDRESWVGLAEPLKIADGFSWGDKLRVVPGVDCGTEVVHLFVDRPFSPSQDSPDRLYLGDKCIANKCARNLDPLLYECLTSCRIESTCHAVALEFTDDGKLAWCEGRRDALLTRVNKKKACVYMKKK